MVEESPPFIFLVMSSLIFIARRLDVDSLPMVSDCVGGSVLTMIVSVFGFEVLNNREREVQTVFELTRTVGVLLLAVVLIHLPTTVGLQLEGPLSKHCASSGILGSAASAGIGRHGRRRLRGAFALGRC